MDYVYCLFYGDWEQSLEGVFSSREKAREAVKYYLKKKDREYVNSDFTIIKQKIDTISVSYYSKKQDCIKYRNKNF